MEHGHGDDRLSVPTILRVVVVSYNSQRDLPSCLTAAVDAAHVFRIELVVVDNGSTDDSVAAAREAGAVVLTNSENLGFARAVNRGLAGASSGLVLLLNPDTRLTERSLGSMVALLKERDVAAIGPRLVTEEGKPNVEGYYLRRPTLRQALLFYTNLMRPFATSAARGRYLEDYSLDADVHSVDQVPGACLLTTVERLTEVGPLDERFPIWFEDVDWCERARRRGLRLLYDGAAEVVHPGGESFSGWPDVVKEIVFYRSMRSYFWKHMPVATPVLVVAVIIDRALRLMVTGRRHHSRFLAGYLSVRYRLPC